MEKFRRILKELRKSKGLTQEKLASEVGTTSTVITKLERGDRKPDIRVLGSLADFFDVNIDYLLGRTEISTPIKKFTSYNEISWTEEEFLEIEEFKKFMLFKRECSCIIIPRDLDKHEPQFVESPSSMFLK